MTIPIYRIFIFALAALVILVGCQSAAPTALPPEPSTTFGATPSKVQAATAYPAAETRIPPVPTSSPLTEAGPYPQPETTQGIAPVDNTGNFAAGETASPGTLSLGPYPGPEEQAAIQAGATTGPYPGPEQAATSTPSKTVQSNLVPPTSVLEPLTATAGAQALPSPTATLTPGTVRTELHATNPMDFDLVSGQVQLVEFFAYWSPTSKSMAPVMYSLEEKYKDRMLFVYLDIDSPPNSLYKTLLGDRLPPIFFLLDAQGDILAEFEGIVKPEEFEAAFELALGAIPIAPTQAPPPTP